MADIWHVNDQKISHVYKTVIEDIIKQLNVTFRNESPLNTTHGKVLEYLEMTLGCTTKGKVKISIYKCLSRRT